MDSTDHFPAPDDSSSGSSEGEDMIEDSTSLTSSSTSSSSSSEDEESSSASSSQTSHDYERIRRHMSRDLAAMMYGLGDDRNPFTETMEAMRDLVMEYVSEVTVSACRTSPGNEVTVESVAYVVRQSSSKSSRIRALMEAIQDLRTVRRAFHVGR